MVAEKYKTLMTLFTRKSGSLIKKVFYIICINKYIICINYKRHTDKANICNLLRIVIKLLHSTTVVICTKPQ